jgi:FkbM family methyltransferase
VSQFHCRCYAVEANPTLFELIKPHPQLAVYNLAIAGTPGRIPLHLSTNPEASSILAVPAGGRRQSVEVDAIRLDGFLQMAGLNHVDLIKCDIEGAEIEVLDSCADEFLQGVGQLAVEFHDFLGLTPVATVERVVGRLEGLGFYPIKLWRHAWGDTLFVNRRMKSANSLKLAWARHVTRHWWGFRRVVTRARGAGR